MLKATMLAVVFLAAVAYAEDDHDHEGEDHGFEFAGLYAVPEDAYVLTLKKLSRGGGLPTYAASTMKLASLAAENGTAGVLDALEGEGEHSLEANCTVANDGDTLTPEEDACRLLILDDRFFRVQFAINTTGISHIALFAEHHFAEFSANVSDDHGDPVKTKVTIPVTFEASKKASEKKWGETIAATLVVLAVTLIGLIFLSPQFVSLRESHSVYFDAFLSSFAAGAILATAVFLLAMESMHLMETKWSDEGDLTWRWGLMILSGIVAPSILDLFVSFVGGPANGDCTSDCHETTEVIVMSTTVLKMKRTSRAGAKTGSKGDLDKDLEGAGADTPPSTSWIRVASSVLIGDFLHNFVDGLFIGSAFTLCGSSFGWTVAAATIYHELPQELSDFFLLTERCHFTRVRALCLNFVAGLSVPIGAIVVLATDIESHYIGLILAFGAGSFFQIGAAECLPRVYHAATTVETKFISVLLFAVGAICIGLVLLDHEHCAAGSADGGDVDAHEGHGHR